MNDFMNPIIDSTVQCWGCSIFDKLIQVLSTTAAAIYDRFAMLCIMIFFVLLVFYIVNSVWDNIKSGVGDPSYQKYLKPILINSLIVFGLFGMGVTFPRIITSITMEPAAQVATTYVQAITKQMPDTINDKITYKSEPMDDNGFFTPTFRDNIIMLMKTTVTQFQGYIKFGIAIMDRAFSWDAILGVGSLLKHIIMFFIGLYLTYSFFRLFIRFCFYFMDIIVGAAFFAFFFPLSLVTFIFKNSPSPKWMQSIGGDYGVGQIKNIISAIVSLATAVLTYTISMSIIASFFASQNADTSEIMEMIMNGSVFEGAIGTDNIATITIMGSVVMVYLINYLVSLVPQISKSIMDSLGISDKNNESEQAADNAMKLTGLAYNYVKTKAEQIIKEDKK